MPTITFRRASNIQNIPITDGQIIFDTARNIILMDNGNVRNQYAGATQLVSTTPEATSTNAFNAQASTQLFLQKTTVIDTKANALAVNQNYVPLGCLAFKEALGTTNYSDIGNGTISGALVTLNNQLSTSGNKFYFDYQNGQYGYNTSANRGADTFHPFSEHTKELLAEIRATTKLPINAQQTCPGTGQGARNYYSYTAENVSYQGNTVTFWTGSCPVCGKQETSDRDWRNMPSHTRTVTVDYSYTVTESMLQKYDE